MKLNRHSRMLWAMSVLMTAGSGVVASQYESDWQADVSRVWIGPDCYATRLQDWQLNNGWAECIESAPNRPMRVLHLLPVWLESGHDATASDDFRFVVDIRPVDADDAVNPDSWAGLLIGCGGPEVDYRLSALRVHTTLKLETLIGTSGRRSQISCPSQRVSDVNRDTLISTSDPVRSPPNGSCHLLAK